MASGILISPIVKWHPFAKRIIGSIFFLVPVLISSFNPANTFLQSPILGSFYLSGTNWVAILIILALMIGDYFAAGDKENLENYPPVRVNSWTPKLLLSSLFTWIVYLSCYEMIFRGLFLSESIRLFGIVPAIALNLAVCSLAHLLKSRREALASIPMAFLMCVLSLDGQSFWYAAIGHSVMAIAHEIFSIRANPSMRFEFFSIQTKKA